MATHKQNERDNQASSLEERHPDAEYKHYDSVTPTPKEQNKHEKHIEAGRKGGVSRPARNPEEQERMGVPVTLTSLSAELPK